jgi:glycosyltransferase involved in cell wall biosynthesis
MATAATTMPEPPLRPLRVRTGNGYSIDFVVDLGQRNARLLRRRWAPLARVFDWADAFVVLPDPDHDLIHSLNAVPILGRCPYVVTFEDYLPRVPEDRYVGILERRLQRSLLSDRCRAIVAMSDYAARQFHHQSRDFAGRDQLERKLEVLRPALGVRRSAPKTHSDGLHLAFVGKDFMRKGGPAVLRAHRRLRAAGIPVTTTIVSAMRWSADDYVGPPDAAYVARETADIAQEGIVHHRSLPNAQVLRVLDDADYLVFPTLHDTFGYVSLEAMAGGTPVVTTATGAQPEVVTDGESGLLLDLENDPDVGKWAWTYRTADPGYLAAYEAAIASLADQLVDRLSDAWEHRDERYEAMSAAALARMRERFDPIAARDRLEQLYELCRR